MGDGEVRESFEEVGRRDARQTQRAKRSVGFGVIREAF